MALSAADIEDLKRPEARLECVQVLALGGDAKSDDGSETGYFAARAAMAKAVSDALQHLARSGLSQKGAPGSMSKRR